MDWAETESLEFSNLSTGQPVTFEAFFAFNLFRDLGLGPMPLRVLASDTP
ncbi:MAG: hypothetical protein ACI87O_003095 [Planctomycetota bacterium]|jgi:hypothetical protein